MSLLICVCVCVCDENEEHLHRTHCSDDLAVVRGHAVSVVEVGEGLGSSPGLQVTGHPDGRPHLSAVQRGTRAHSQQRAVSLSLGKPNHIE